MSVLVTGDLNARVSLVRVTQPRLRRLVVHVHVEATLQRAFDLAAKNINYVHVRPLVECEVLIAQTRVFDGAFC